MAANIRVGALKPQPTWEGAASSGVSRHPRQGARLPASPPGKLGYQVFVASLRNVRGPPKLQPCLTEKYDDGADPSESLQICTAIIEAAGGDDRVMANVFPMALRGQAWGWPMNLLPPRFTPGRTLAILSSGCRRSPGPPVLALL
uniref:OSJNBa0084K11.13 protein n=1 Tax=Oryza sativa subsp. japonica TaxID=39947 RepID=Q7XUR5_ORYSJ|nr:OSJNBa0084K11.13 [Oryza sativa Japonica Group]